MDVVIIYVVIAVALFIAAFVAKRRFGLLGLALSAGSLMSDIWGYEAGLIVSMLGIQSTPLAVAVTLSVVVLLPAFVLLFHGYTYKTLVGRVIGAGEFTLLALAFLIEPLGHVLVPHGAGVEVYNWLADNQSFIIGIGLIIAVVDLFLTKPAKLSKKRH